MTARTLSMDADAMDRTFLYYGFMQSPLPRRRVISLLRRGFTLGQIYCIGCDWECGMRHVPPTEE